MFDKFTDRARKVMSLAQDEARGLGQIILVQGFYCCIALIKRGRSIAAQAAASWRSRTSEGSGNRKETHHGRGAILVDTFRLPPTQARGILRTRETMTHGQAILQSTCFGHLCRGNELSAQ